MKICFKTFLAIILIGVFTCNGNTWINQRQISEEKFNQKELEKELEQFKDKIYNSKEKLNQLKEKINQLENRINNIDKKSREANSSNAIAKTVKFVLGSFAILFFAYIGDFESSKSSLVEKFLFFFLFSSLFSNC
ncbi:MAG: hypothetical protein LBJ32_03655 [Oscillospiraceae bacterium]|jgi:vesicle coat complex subunit|nr:hypothetical protein [Oscillospiraceae bacterium]